MSNEDKMREEFKRLTDRNLSKNEIGRSDYEFGFVVAWKSCAAIKDAEIAASKQRELELLAVIARARFLLEDGMLAEAGNVLCAEPSQALRDLKASVLVTASNVLDDLWVKGKLQTKGAGNELRRMAEERRLR